MIHVLVQVEVENLERFWRVFATRGAELRAAHGSLGANAFTDTDDPSKVMILFEWESRESLERCFSDDVVREMIESGGAKTPRRYKFLKHLGELPS